MSGKFRIELIAFTGLLLLGVVGPSEPAVIFSGFGHPALITIVTIFIVSQAIVKSEALRGLGQLIERKINNLQGQILGLSLISSFLSAFMNNVGAIGLLLPTAMRMSDRKKIDRSIFGLPLAFASIVGGSLTLIGSGPNIIAASFMYSATGQFFQMFDFLYHGLAMLITGLIMWSILSKISNSSDRNAQFIDDSNGSNELTKEIKTVKEEEDEEEKEEGEEEWEAKKTNQTPVKFAPFSHPTKQKTVFIVLLAILTISTGTLHPALGFGAAGLLLVFAGVLSISDAFQAIDLKIVIFLGSMLGIGEILEDASSINLLSDFLIANMPDMSPLVLILILIFIATVLSNGVNNSASAVFMAPLAIAFAEQSALETAAALMAVAAGANLALLLPTHQAVLMVLSKASFSPRNFVKIGSLLTIALGLSAGMVIYLVWQ